MKSVLAVIPGIALALNILINYHPQQGTLLHDSLPGIISELYTMS